ncbi:MAG TPA: hypothetical protein VG755_36895 [Nannocystaceae bacterium]|nr:hypothetical protein [Nannocystaceae bacterium]
MASWCVLVACGPSVPTEGQDGSGSADEGSDDGSSEVSSDTDVAPSRCGDGIVDPGESCDAGAATSACNEYCRVPGSIVQEVILGGCGAQAVRGDSDGDVVVLEYGCITGTNVLAVQVTRVDAAGAPRWSEFWTDPESSYARATALALDADGNAIVAGGAGSGNIVAPTADYAYVRKHARDGTLAWMDTHVRDEHGNSANDIAVDGDGNVFEIGGDVDVAWLRKLDPDGAPLWDVEYPLVDGLASDTRIAASSTGAFVVAMNQQPDDDDWITAVASYGIDATELWSAVIDRSEGGRDLPEALVLAVDGTVHLTGEFESPATYDNTVFVEALSPAGASAWSWEHDAPSDACGIAVDHSGNSFVLMRVGEYEAESLVVTRLSAAGAVEWQSTIAGPSKIGIACGITLDAAENPVVAAAPLPDQSWVAWLAR